MGEIVAEGIIEAKALRDFADVFIDLVDEARIHWNDDGLLARVVDSANVAMLRASLSTDYFESYDAPGAVTIGINLTKLLERIKPADSNDLIHLAVDMETRDLKIKYGNASLGMALIDPDAIRKEPDIPDLDLPNWMVVEGQHLRHAYEITDIVTDHLFVRGKPDEKAVEFVGQGDTDDATVTLGEDEISEASVDEATESVFSLIYIDVITDPIPPDADVTVSFGDEFPIKIYYEALNGHLAATAHIAPRIVNE